MFQQLMLITIFAWLPMLVTSDESSLEVQLICPGVNLIKPLFFITDSVPN
jgi:hypothetical protein